MEISTLLLAGVALYLIKSQTNVSKTLKSEIDSLKSDLNTVTTSFSDYKQDQEVKEELQQIESDAAAADADVASKCYPVSFFGIIGNYYTSDKYISAAWFVKFKNTSYSEITVHLESISVTILNSKQVGHQTDIKSPTITIPPQSESLYMLVSEFYDDILYGYSTVGKDIQMGFPDNRYDYWYKSSATLKYTLSNPYINNGLAVDAPARTLTCGVYGMRVYSSNSVDAIANDCAAWVDYLNALDDYYWKKIKEALGVTKPEQIQAALDASYENRKKFIQIYQTKPPIEKPVIKGIETNDYLNQ